MPLSGSWLWCSFPVKIVVSVFVRFANISNIFASISDWLSVCVALDGEPCFIIPRTGARYLFMPLFLMVVMVVTVVTLLLVMVLVLVVMFMPMVRCWWWWWSISRWWVLWCIWRFDKDNVKQRAADAHVFLDADVVLLVCWCPGKFFWTTLENSSTARRNYRICSSSSSIWQFVAPVSVCSVRTDASSSWLCFFSNSTSLHV